MNPEFMWNIFSENHVKYNLRRGKILKLPSFPARNGQNTLLFRAVMAWNSLPCHVKAAETLTEFKSLLIGLVEIYCQCQYCR